MERRTRIDGWPSIHEFAKTRGRSVRTIRNYTKRGLRHAKVGATVLIDEADWPAFVEAHARGGNLEKRR